MFCLVCWRLTLGMTQNELTLVVGGTGKTGRRVAQRLTERGVPIRLAARSTEPRFDWDDESTWAPVLDGVTSIYLTYAPDAGFPGAAELIGAFARRAVDAGARRIVLLTGRGEAGAERSEAAVAATGADLTILRASFFAQNFSEDMLIDQVLAGQVAFPADQVREPFVDLDDLADVAVATLTEPGHIGRTYDVTGPELLTFAEAVAEIAAATGKDIHYHPISGQEMQAGLTEAGLPADFAARLVELFAEVLDGRNATLGDGVHQVLNRTPRTFSTFAKTTFTP